MKSQSTADGATGGKAMTAGITFGQRGGLETSRLELENHHPLGFVLHQRRTNSGRGRSTLGNATRFLARTSDDIMRFASLLTLITTPAVFSNLNTDGLDVETFYCVMENARVDSHFQAGLQNV